MGKEKKGSGYSMSITYDVNGKPVVKVETYGQVDAAELRRAIHQRYPNAKIEGLGEQKLIRIVDEEETEMQKKHKTGKETEKEERKAINTNY